MKKIKFKRIYHSWEKWEDYKHGFYENCSGGIKKEMIDSVIEMFNDEQKTTTYMNKVINEWKNSCEHNLTNEGMNKIAYIGQAACCLYNSIPSTVTMEAWSLLSKDVQDRANNIAISVIEEWEQNNINILEHA